MDYLIALCVYDTVCSLHDCTCATNIMLCMRAYMCACARACATRCVCTFHYVMITCAHHDVLVSNMMPVSILVTEQFGNTVENIHKISLFCCFALPALVIH